MKTLFRIAAVSLLLGLAEMSSAENFALQFDGQNDFVDLGACNELRQAQRNFTIECWFKTESGQGEQVLITNRHQDDGADFPSVTIRAGRINFCVDEQGRRADIQGRNMVNDNRWHHFAGTIDGNTWTLYVDGQQDGQLNNGINLGGSNYNLHFGHHGAWRVFYPGAIDEVRIWLVTRTAEQIADNRNVMLRGDEQGLYAYWNFDEGEGQSTRDLTGHGHEGVLGVNNQQANDDPQWIESEAPIFGGELEINREEMFFPPTAIGHPRQLAFVLSNISDEEDQRLEVQYELTYDGQRPAWLTVEPLAGRLPPGEEVEIAFDVDGEGIEPGNYETTVRFQSNAVNIRSFDIPVSVTIVEGIGSLNGRVTDARDDSVIPNAAIEVIADYELSTVSDGEGGFNFADLPAHWYQFRVTAPDLLVMISDTIVVHDGEEVDLDFALLHSRMRPESESVELSLQSDDSLTASLALNNPGNGPLTWSAALDFPDELELDPWSLRQDYPVGAITEDDRIQAVTYAEGEIYLAGSADQQKRIYVMNREGELQRSFGQLSPSRYGFSGLTWDGEMLWGAADPVIYGFNTEGDSVASFESPLNPANNVVWDNDRGLFWLASITSNILGCDREGNLVTTLLRRGMRIYGLGYYPEDPDGHQIYVLTNPSGTTQIVMKLDIADSDTMRAFVIPDEGGRPAGCAITNQFDPYSWVFLGVNNLADADMLNVFHLSANTGWVAMLAGEGVVEAGGSEEFLLHFDTEGLQQDLVYETLIRFNHDGVGGVTEVPVSLTITGDGGLTQRNLSLGFGWILVSVNLTPQIGEEGGSGFVDVVQPLVDAGALIFAKDGAGNFYRPDAGFDGIGEWAGTLGYWLKVNRATELRVPGVGIGAGSPIELSQGWNTVSYLPRAPMEALEALSGLGESLILARDGSGRFYLPAYGYSDMGRLREGFGYQVKVAEAGELVYGGGELVAGLPTRWYAKADLAWLEELPRTGRMHHLLVKSSLQAGTRLEALTESGIVAGRGVVGEDGLAGVTLWGDDPDTREVEGFVEGEENGKWKMENGTASLTPHVVAGEMAFTDGGWGVVELEGSAVPVEFGLTSLYPNPFNSTLKISFSLPGFGEAGLRVYDLAGREVAGLASGPYAAGMQSVIWNAEGFASGVYVVRLEAAGEVATRKVVLVR